MIQLDIPPLFDTFEFLNPQKWGTTFQIERGAFESNGILTSQQLDNMLDTSLLRWPYLSVLRQGAVPALSAYTKDRDVIGHARDGFVDGPAVRGLMAQGATLKLNKLSDWHRPSRSITEYLENRLPVAVSSYAFWTPKQSQGMLPHRDGSHVIVLQLEGKKQWQLFAADPEDVRADAGLDVNSTTPSDEFELEPGDVLYLPHGWPHVTRTVSEEPSLHLTFTLAEATPESLLEAFSVLMKSEGGNLITRYHQLSLADRVLETQRFLADLVESDINEEIINQALSGMRRNEG